MVKRIFGTKREEEKVGGKLDLSDVESCSPLAKL
jgi:hypothetical protein